MAKKKTYSGSKIDVTFDLGRCIHAAQCGANLPDVFDAERRPWVQPENADADSIARVVEGCPTGALHYERKDCGSSEVPVANTITVAVDGPLWLTGDIVVRDADGEEVARDVRMALCRCGQSAFKPLCDNSHLKKKFRAPGLPGLPERSERSEPESELSLIAAKDGPILVRALCRLTTDESTSTIDGKAALCRCGSSKNKPFCDGSHKEIGFEG